MRQKYSETRPICFHDDGLRDDALSDYLQEWDRMRDLHAQVATGELGPQMLLVEHAPVYTAGRRTQDHERPFDGTPVIDVDRGGKITWHGPGQLVGYPILRLGGTVGVLEYVTRIEEALISYLATIGIKSGRIKGQTGVWVPGDEALPDRKICAIGIRILKQTSMHGFSLNVSNDLAPFANMIPCGIDNAGVTSITNELGSAPTLYDVAQGLKPLVQGYLKMNQFTQSPDLNPDTNFFFERG
ncbi:MAG: lipoyl(octanoyl) transferase LipB [Propionibacteriaceae bacterium]